MPAVPLSYQMDKSHRDQSSRESYSSGSAASSKQASPAPSNHSESNRGSPPPKNSGSTKGKLFQCTGFGDCRMVFTRSEHLARHARKHTGEKPFQCVVDGCTRMFSRFDNMVQHTQTHTKGARRESAAGIASKIALESRRKSEAGLLNAPTSSTRGANKAPKTKRSSISSASGSEAVLSSMGRRSRTYSMPLANVEDLSPAQNKEYDPPKAGLTTTTTSSLSTLASFEPSFRNPKRNCKQSQTLPKSRRASMGSPSSSSTTLSWYASKLHHKSSMDGNDQFGGRGNLDTHLMPLNLHQYDHAMDQSSYRPRHPLSPDHSSHSEDDDEDSDEMDFSVPCSRGDVRPWSWGGMVNSMNDCTLPPLRTSNDATQSMRLPSISSSGYRSRSISYEYHPDQPHGLKSRRLSLADLEAPIYESKKVVDHSIQTRQAQFEGIDVSEDEIHALEAFGELWSQGRAFEKEPMQQLESSQSPPSLPLSKEPVIKSEYDQFEQLVPGLDMSRRSPRRENTGFSRPQDMRLVLDMAMDLD
ncbi:hypothetical protein BGX21_004736 [Mortierella sp. AD011]|nr:hypothetical protein BGX20_004687 [Mortierella sp. AD010]KAF9372603.1 hypothetical protein BGX21_004736 [Mortierella sp. AD011]